MDGNLYYVMLGAFGLASLLLFRNGHFWPGIIFALLTGWTYYSHETGASYSQLKDELNRAVDESVEKTHTPVLDKK